MGNSSKYFSNKECEYYPCHKNIDDMNCLFCYCPMYTRAKCPGNLEYKMTEGRKVKVCTNCTFPHNPENYDVIMGILKDKQAYNPYLPLNEYIPDGEPHVFGDRIYIFGSHDKEGGHTFCMEDYVTYSANINDLTNWRYEGVIYKASQDPQYPKLKYMFAPDVVEGNDGKYYLYYGMGGIYGFGGYVGPISVAVADNPAGPYEFHGFVRNKDGSPMEKYVCFDPAVINDNGVIRLYYGTQYGIDGSEEAMRKREFEETCLVMFGVTEEEFRSYKDNMMGPITVTLEDDMLTIKEEPKHCIPYDVRGTGFAAHPFFEGSSIRKVGDKYYFIYSSWQNHELVYGMSDKPDEGFVFGGTIVSTGDVGLNGRKENERLNMTGTTHGSIVKVKDQWYVFYHRLTHKSDYSRQSCAEKIYFDENGFIKQVEVTSAGLNDGPLRSQGKYPAVIACNITNGMMPHGSNSVYEEEFPNVTDKDDERFIAEIEHGTLIGFKYFKFDGDYSLKVVVRDDELNKVKFDGPLRLDERCVGSMDEKHRIYYASSNPTDECFFEVRLSEFGEAIGKIPLYDIGKDWKECLGGFYDVNGVYPLYLVYHGNKKVQLKEIIFEE